MCQKTCHLSSVNHEAHGCFYVVFIISSVYFRSWTRQAANYQMIAGFSPHFPNTKETSKSSDSGSNPLLPRPGKGFPASFSHEIDQSKQNLEILWITSYTFPSSKFAYLPRKKHSSMCVKIKQITSEILCPSTDRQWEYYKCILLHTMHLNEFQVL